MAFGLKYELLCTTRKGNLYTAKIYFDGYIAADIDRNVPVSPFKLRKDKAAVIRGTSFEFSIREEVDFEFLGFYTNNSRNVKVELYDPSNNLIWVGFNLPQQYQVPYTPAPANVTFTATDGLGLLKNETFTLTGRNSELDIIRHCVDKIGLSLGYSIAINLFEVTHNHLYSPLAQTYEDSEIFDGYNCYEVLEFILNKYNAEITQRRGRWAITRSADKKSTRMLYTSAGVYDTTEAAPAVLDLGQLGVSGVEVYPRGSLQMGLQSGGKRVKITHDFARKNSFLANPDFSVFSAGVFAGWSKTGTFTPEQRYNDNGPYAFLPGNDESSSCIYQEFQVENAPGEDFVLSIDMGVLASRLYGGVPVPILVNLQMNVMLVSGGTTKYLSKSGTYPDLVAEWVDTLTAISMQTGSQIGGTPNFNRLTLITQELPFSGTLRVTLYRIQSAPIYQHTFLGVAFCNVNLSFVDNGEPYPSGIETLASFTNSSEPSDLQEVNLLAADAPDYANAGLLYRFITWLASGDPTTVWHILGSATERSILQQLAYALASDNRVARQKLTGELKGTGIAFDSIIKHAYNNNREFEIAEGIWDIYEEVFNVTLLELLPWSDETVTFADVVSNVGSATGVSSGTASAQIIPEDILAALLTVDGSGSGLDADLLDGQHASYYALATHNHTGVYSPVGHDHDTVYANISHAHTAYSLTSHNHDTVYAAISHNHDSAYVSIIGAPLTGQLAEITAGGEITNSGRTISDFEAAISKSTGYLKWNGSAWTFVNETYSLSSHDHTGVYSPVGHDHDSVYANISHTHTAYSLTSHNHDTVYAAISHNHDSAYVSIIGAPLTGQLAEITAGGEITNSGRTISDFEAAISKATGYLKWNGTAWAFVNETYSLSSHNHSGTYEPVLGNPSANGDLLSSTTGGSRSWKSINALYTAYQTLTDGATITWNMNSGYNAVVTLGGNRTLAITNAVNGMSGCLVVKQDATGSRTLTLPTGAKIIGGGMTLSTAANAIDILTWTYDGTDFLWSYGKNYIGTA